MYCFKKFNGEEFDGQAARKDLRGRGAFARNYLQFFSMIFALTAHTWILFFLIYLNKCRVSKHLRVSLKAAFVCFLFLILVPSVSVAAELVGILRIPRAHCSPLVHQHNTGGQLRKGERNHVDTLPALVLYERIGPMHSWWSVTTRLHVPVWAPLGT